MALKQTKKQSRFFRNAHQVRKNKPCSCFVTVNSSQVFEEANMLDSIEARRNWTRTLPFTIETLHGRIEPSPDGEQELKYGHSRFDLLGPVGPNCLALEKYGRGDGEKRACGLKKLMPSMSDCIIVSLGSANRWDFELSVFQDLPLCRIETFDCTISKKTKPPAKISSRTTFHNVCIGSHDNVTSTGQVFMSWPSILQLIKAKEAPLYLKMDIDGYEYDVLRSIIDDGALMPTQIALELHYRTQMSLLPWHLRRKGTAELATFMEYLHRYGGYFLIDRHDNRFCSHCTEILISRLPCSCTR
jgi:hypothetical protein